MELVKTKWYTSPEQQKQGWGADYYKVGETIGLGGVRLWDGEKVLHLNPVSERIARVVQSERDEHPTRNPVDVHTLGVDGGC